MQTVVRDENSSNSGDVCVTLPGLAMLGVSDTNDGRNTRRPAYLLGVAPTRERRVKVESSPSSVRAA